MIKIVLFCFFAFSLPFISQSQDIDFDVHYASDKSAITKENELEIRKVFSTLDRRSIKEITLTGHTDSDASEDYNLKLSEARVNGVQEFLQLLGVADNLVASSFEGETSPIESNSTSQGKSANRRVSIHIEMKPKLSVIIEGAPEPSIDCNKDTLISLLTGGKYRINICDYVRNPDCVKLKEIGTVETLGEMGMNTMSEDNEALISAGMVQYDICEGVEIRYLLPIRSQCDAEGMTLWQMTEDGTWHEESDETLKPVEVDGQAYYELGLVGQGIKNCDKRPESGGQSVMRKTRFKVKRTSGLKIKSVTLYCGCPLRAAQQNSKKDKGRKVVVSRPKDFCCPNMQVMIEAIDANGAEIIMTQRPLVELDGNTFMGNCPTTERKRFLFIRTRNKAFHRKYKLNKNDFE